MYILFSHFRPRDATRGNSFFQMSSYARANLRITNEKQKENSHEGITWSEMGKQNVQAEKVYCPLKYVNKVLKKKCNAVMVISCWLRWKLSCDKLDVFTRER